MSKSIGQILQQVELKSNKELRNEGIQNYFSKAKSLSFIELQELINHSIPDTSLHFNTCQNQKSQYPSYKLGSLSSSFESNGDPAAIGYDATGGYSYGTYQIETKNGTMKDFITFLNNSPNNMAYSLRLQNADGLKGAADKTPAFEKAWKELAQDSGFVQAQRDFIIEKKLRPLLKKIDNIRGLDLDKRHPVIKDALYSLAVQHGRADLIVKRAFGADASGYNDEEFINKLYQSRIDYVSSLTQMNPREQYNIIHYRYPQERNRALEYLKII